MSGEPQLVYWDSCIFLAWMGSDKNRTKSEIDGISEMAENFDKGELQICTSVLTIGEVLRNRSKGDESYHKFKLFIQNPNFALLDVTQDIAEIAHEIRDYSSKNKGVEADTLLLPDAMHLASSIIFGCEIFYTFDGTDKNGKNISLLPLSGSIAESYFQIIKVPSPSPGYQNNPPTKQKPKK